MPDYNFSGLSTRSFEQLTQAIAAKILGPNTIIFGDGPDGAREATFDGPTHYQVGSEAWSGYIVVQAKFRQMPQSQAKDAAWALAQLTAELKKFTNRKRALRRPEYYIFATNVAFSAVYKTGTKDKAYARLTKFKDTLKLRGFDVWDYDKLRSLLDNAEDIRHAYGAWITPGDVLADLIGKLALKQANFDEVLTNFLQKELLSDRYANLEQAGHTVDERVPLATVFVDLPALDEPYTEPPEDSEARAGFVSQVLEVAREKFGGGSLSRLGAGISPQDQLGSRAGKFVLVGGPGQGKTTVGQFVCQLFRTAILSQKPRKSMSNDVVDAIQEINDQCKSEKITPPIVRRFPLRVVLSEFAARLDAENESLLSYMAGRIRKRTNQVFNLDDFRRWLRAYPWVLVLDGLDEVPPSSNREELLQAIREFWIDAAECDADILVIATTRPQGYSDDFSPKFYGHKWLAPLSNKRALHYAQRLVDVRYSGEEERKEKILKRLQRACRQDATSRLMYSPLQVTIMATLVDRVGQPPQERWNLFREYYTVIYEREMERDTPLAVILREYQADVNAIHFRVGLRLQVESEKTGKTDAKLPLERFRQIVRTRLSEEGHAGKQLHQLEEKIMAAAMHRLVFLVGLEQKQVGFEVRSLQEFMAAEGLMQGPEDDLSARLRRIAPISHWRNVFLFAAGKCFAERQHLRDTVHTICLQLNDDPDPATKSVLTGSQLAVDLLEDGPAKKQPKYSASLLRVGFRLLDLPPTDYQLQLANLCSSEFEPIFIEELSSRLSHKCHAQQLGAWNALSRLVPRFAFARKLKDTHWPSDKTEQFHTARYAGSLRDLFEKLSSLAPDFPPSEVDEEFDFVESSDLSPLFRMPMNPMSHRVVAETFGSVPDWFQALVMTRMRMRYGYFRPDILLRYPKNQGEQYFRLQIFCFTEGQGEFLTPLKNVPGDRSFWQLHTAVGTFLENPTKTTLAMQLRRLAETRQIGFERNPWWVPWVLGACLGDRSPTHLLQLSDAVLRGELGDLEDWRAAERRWLSKGVTLDEFNDGVGSLPFTKEIREWGFPCRAHQRALISHFWGMDPSSVPPLIEEFKNSLIGGELAERYLSILGSERDYHDKSVKDFSQLRQLLPLVRRGGTLNAPALAVLFPSAIGEEWIVLIDKLAKEASWIVGPRRRLDSLARELWKAFMADRNRKGLVRLLAELSATTLIPEIPFEYLDPTETQNQRLRAAEIVLLLTQEVARSKGPELAKHAAALDFEIEALLRDVNNVLRGRSHDVNLANSFLLSLLDMISASKSDTRGRILAVLNSQVRRRQSKLDDQAVWKELKLFAN